MEYKILRPAIAMIELIFAIVIMGITLLSAPLILNLSIQSSNTAIQQESIAAAASQLSLVLTHPWDEGNTNAATGYGILQTTSEDTELNATVRLSANTRTFGNRSYNTGMTQTQSASLPNTFGPTLDTVTQDDIDDFHGLSHEVKLYSASEESILKDNEGEYLKGMDFSITTSVSYGVDEANYGNPTFTFSTPFTLAPANQSSNIKLISVTLQSTGAAATAEEHSQSITLRAFTCNIGSSFNGAADRMAMPPLVAGPVGP